MKVNIDCLHFVCILANRIGLGSDLDVWICLSNLINLFKPLSQWSRAMTENPDEDDNSGHLRKVVASENLNHMGSKFCLIGIQ